MGRSPTTHSLLAGSTLAVACFAAVASGAEHAEMMCGYRSAQGPARFDSADGGDPGHYAPDRAVEYRHIRLELVFDDPASRSFTGTATYTIRSAVEGVGEIRLNAVDLAIRSVRRADGAPLEYDYDGKTLTIAFEGDLPSDRERRVEVRYVCSDPIEGMHFVVPPGAGPGAGVQVHTLGQPEYNRYWFPCHDFPNMRSTTELVVTVPRGYDVLSNGRLSERREAGARVTYYWRQDQPHVAYLVTLVIGRYAVVADRWRDIPVTYWVPPGREVDARRTFARTAEMIAFYSELLGYDYPFDQYAQVCVWEFGLGGMEHTSATTLYDQVLLDARAAVDHDQDGLISHELVHQWFGDLITCRTWGHIWLNEGFATFFDELWYEHWKGPARYRYDKWRTYQRVAEADGTDAPDAVVWNRYRRPDDTFRHKGGLPYGKGASLLHMLRHELGDEVFFAGVRAYVRKYAFHTVETADFRHEMEAASGRTLEAFFAQWAYRPGVPRFDIDYHWDDDTNTARVVIRQRQPIDADHPAYSVPLDLYFRSHGEIDRFTVRLRRRKEVTRRRFDTRPDLFCVDPDAGLLKSLDVDKPRSLWLNQLVDGPTVPARCEAARHLAEMDRPEVVAALVGVVTDDATFWGVRAEAAAALGVLQTDRARAALVTLLDRETPPLHPKARAAAVEALGRYRSDEGTRVLVRLAADDPSYAVAAAATRGLGRAPGDAAFDGLRAAAARDSYRDRIRIAAVEGLAERGDPRGLAVCEEVAAAGHHDRTRPEALEAMGRLAHRGVQRARVERRLIDTLTDPQRRARRGAMRGLSWLCGSAAYDALRGVARDDPRGDQRDAAREAVDHLMEICDPAAAAGLLWRELDALRTRADRVAGRIDAEAGRLDIQASSGDDVDGGRDE